MWPVKNCQISTKLLKMISLENWKISTTLQKLTKMWALGQNNCCHRLWKVAQSSIYCPIWSHCNRQVVVVVMHQKFVLQNTIVCLFVCLPSIQFKKINKQDRSIGKRKYFLGHTFFSVQMVFFVEIKNVSFSHSWPLFGLILSQERNAKNICWNCPKREGKFLNFFCF